MEHRPRAVGIDYGTKRVGLAVSDPLRLFAQPIGTIGPDEVLDRLEALRREHAIDIFVVGWPLSPEGGDATAIRMVQPFINRLQRRFPGVRIITWDERYSSERARHILLEAGAPRRARRDKDRLNAAAAAVILQEYLDRPDDAEGE